ncbi:MAG: histidine kinase N-terminal 7TM domain-containing protein [Bacillota bacterium]|nr:histidine kinase N-terminal 7TM domain-containing protein [Bacillota bacterium]
MNITKIIEICLQLISAGTTLITFIYLFLRCRKTYSVLGFMSCQAVVFLWTLIYSLELVFAHDTNSKTFFLLLECSIISFLGTNWLTFCLYHCGKVTKTVNRIILLCYTITIICSLLFATNSKHHLLFVKVGVYEIIRGRLFWLLIIVIILEMMIGDFILILHALRQRGDGKRQSILLIFGTICPMVCATLTLSTIAPNGFDLTPPSFSVTLLFYAIAIYKYRFLNVASIALKSVVSNMQEAILIVDCNNSIRYINAAFKRAFDGYLDARLGQSVKELMPALKNIVTNSNEHIDLFNSIESGEREFLPREIELNLGHKAFVEVYVKFATDRNGNKLGRILSLNDITYYKNLIVELNKMNMEIEDNADMDMELTIQKEKHRIARDSHDTLGRNMTLLISSLELAEANLNKDKNYAKQLISNAIEFTSVTINELKKSIDGISETNIDNKGIMNSLNELIHKWNKLGVNIELTATGPIPSLSYKSSKVLFRVCEEAITNSQKHGKAKNISIVIKFGQDNINLIIMDDGIGCSKVIKGMGLSGMENRIKELSGSIIFGSDGEKGFIINIDLPINQSVTVATLKSL